MNKITKELLKQKFCHFSQNEYLNVVIPCKGEQSLKNTPIDFFRFWWNSSQVFISIRYETPENFILAPQLFH